MARRRGRRRCRSGARSSRIPSEAARTGDTERAAALEAANHPSKRVREEEAGLRFVAAAAPEAGEHAPLFHVGPHERLEDLFQFPAIFEINAYFAELGYPAMLAAPDVLLHETVWHGLGALQPGMSRRAADVVRRNRDATANEVRELMRCVPPSGARVVAALANLIVRPENAELTRLFVELFCRASPRGLSRLPLFFGRPLAESQMERILAAVAMSPFLHYAPAVPTAMLWTVDFDPPAMVSLAGLAQLPASCRALREALSAKCCIPASHLRLADPLSGRELELEDMVAVSLIHFVIAPM